MHAKAVPVIVALLSLFLVACSSESGTPPTAEKNHPAQDASQTSAGNFQPVSLTDKKAKDLAANTCTTILNTHCTVCHHATRICQKLGRKNTKGWQQTINNMIGHGAQITPKETESLVRCLDLQEQQIKDYCQ